MKKNIFNIVLLAVIVFFPFVSFAQNTLEEKNREREQIREEANEQKEEALQKRETIREELQAKKEAVMNSVEERRQNTIERVQERLDQFVANVIKRFEAAVERLSTLSKRIESRIAKLKSENIDVGESEKLLTEAKSKIEIAKTNISKIVITVDGEINIESLKTAFRETRKQIESVKSDIKSAHAALVDVIESLKQGQAKLDEKTSTENKTE